MALNKKKKKAVQIIGLIAIIALMLTSFAPAISLFFAQQ